MYIYIYTSPRNGAVSVSVVFDREGGAADKCAVDVRALHPLIVLYDDILVYYNCNYSAPTVGGAITSVSLVGGGREELRGTW